MAVLGTMSSPLSALATRPELAMFAAPPRWIAQIDSQQRAQSERLAVFSSCHGYMVSGGRRGAHTPVETGPPCSMLGRPSRWILPSV